MTVGRLERCTYTFDYPVASDITIVYEGLSGDTEVVIPKGTTTARGEPLGGVGDPIEQIIPSEDNIYIYTW